ncbi:MAG: MATE family efflux transporter [Marinobacterium sp.]|nr:MATE family efflux transporter [Marinobacterium sp.]
MSAHTHEAQRMLTGGTTVNFIRFVIPSIIGLLAVSSAGVVDGIFVGSYVGSTALAAVNLVTPLYSLFFGLCVMMVIGGSVIVGKALGVGNLHQASNIFTKSLLVILVYALVMSALAFFYAEQIAMMMGAKSTVLLPTTEYIQMIAPFLPGMALAYTLSSFARVDDAPNFALAALLLVAVLNVLLDALFIKVWGWGIGGAAYATGIAYVAGALMLLGRLFSRIARVRLIRPYGAWSELFRAAYNGLSEFINEISSGLVMFVINWILMLEIGASGVAAFTIVNYIIWLSIMTAYGTAEGLGPLVSVNFGAGQHARIRRFLRLAVWSSMTTGVALVLLLLIYPEKIVSAFIGAEAGDTLAMTLDIITIIWPLFLFNGLNITVSAYFTGMQAAAHSAAIALSRSLVLPLLLVVMLWQLLGIQGAFVALPVAELLTFGLSLLLYLRAQPEALIAADQRERLSVAAGSARTC